MQYYVKWQSLTITSFIMKWVKTTWNIDIRNTCESATPSAIPAMV